MIQLGKQEGREPSLVVMLDFDGVILDSKDLLARLFLKALKKNGFAWLSSVDEVLALGGQISGKLRERGLAAAQLDAVYLDYADMVLQAGSQATLFRGMGEVLRELYPWAYLYVVTEAAKPAVVEALQLYKIAVDGIYASEFKKSKTVKIKHLLARHGGLPAFYVGERASDLLECAEAGAVPIAAEWGWHSVANGGIKMPAFHLKSPAALGYLLSRLAASRDQKLANQVS